MKAFLLTAGLLAAAVTVGSNAVQAADLDYRTVPPPDRYSSAYEDPRYRDLYGPEPRVYSHSQAPRYYEPAPHPVPPAYVYRPGDRYADRGADDWRFAQGCVPRDEIKRRLIDSGWHDFHDLDVSTRATRVKARRPNGDVFALKVDRCNGEIIRADLIERGAIGPYAYGGSQRRYERPYY